MVPAGHAVQVVDPGSEEYLPFGQGVQVEEPDADE